MTWPLLHYCPFVKRVQMTGSTELWCDYEEKVELTVICDVMALMRRHCNKITLELGHCLNFEKNIYAGQPKMISLLWRHICVTAPHIMNSCGKGLFFSQFIQAQKWTNERSALMAFVRVIHHWKGPIKGKASQRQDIVKDWRNYGPSANGMANYHELSCIHIYLR